MVATPVWMVSKPTYINSCCCANPRVYSAWCFLLWRINSQFGNFLVQSADKMVNAIKGLFISCDVPMAQFIVNLNDSLPQSEKFIGHILDPTHMFVYPHVAEMIRSKIAEFRDQNSYEKPQ